MGLMLYFAHYFPPLELPYSHAYTELTIQALEVLIMLWSLFVALIAAIQENTLS